ncbi:XdhC family protein [Alicyclobacillus sp.]|uniref:XdhC family protein n=1 Tax=Alicyclobacillus sp. TaxID=61169 RepID=UPI0025C26E91|nr:XdhC/CoxI family protein [Alicyclobacillus sp.]MCL6515889.1 XdhC family protein [Alicyclobacillus sp.]
MEPVIERLNEVWERGETAVLASIIQVLGSAYRREGAKMLFEADGRQVGTLSAGCLEEDMRHRAEQVLSTGQPRIQVYDMAAEDDFTWGRGAGCNGVITVLVERVPAEAGPARDYWQAMLDAYRRNEAVAGLRRLDERTGETLGHLVVAGGAVSGTLGDAALDARWTPRLTAFAAQTGRGQAEREGGAWMVLDRVVPKDQLYIFGAGPDAEPLAALAARTGFAVTVVDHRPARLNPSYFPDARLVDCRPEHAAERLEIPAQAFAVVMTHSFQHDRVWVSHLLGQRLRYLGVLGPRQRTERLLQSTVIPPHVKSPVGLAIGADGPQEIAVSVMAELIQLRRTGRI